MMKIHRSADDRVVLALCGRMDEEDVVELERLIGLEGKERPIVLDLKDLTLAGQDGIAFLGRCEDDGIALLNCARYVREWIISLRSRS